MITAGLFAAAGIGAVGVAALGSATAGGIVLVSRHKKKKAKKRQLEALKKEDAKHFELESTSVRQLEAILGMEPQNSYVLYELGIRAENQSDAKNYLQKAASLNHATAAYEIGKRFLSGDFQPQCEITAKDFFTQAATLRHLDGMFALAALLEKDSHNDEAKRWYKKCVKQQSAPAAERLAYLKLLDAPADAQYEHGVHIRQENPNEAITWFQKAADREHSHASYELAQYYLQGNYVDKNEDRAVMLLLQAARQGHVAAAMMLVDFYEEKQVYTEAIQWLDYVVSLGRKEYQPRLERLRRVLQE